MHKIRLMYEKGYTDAAVCCLPHFNGPGLLGIKIIHTFGSLMYIHVQPTFYLINGAMFLCLRFQTIDMMAPKSPLWSTCDLDSITLMTRIMYHTIS